MKLRIVSPIWMWVLLVVTLLFMGWSLIQIGALTVQRRDIGRQALLISDFYDLSMKLTEFEHELEAQPAEETELSIRRLINKIRTDAIGNAPWAVQTRDTLGEISASVDRMVHMGRLEKTILLDAENPLVVTQRLRAEVRTSQQAIAACIEVLRAHIEGNVLTTQSRIHRLGYSTIAACLLAITLAVFFRQYTRDFQRLVEAEVALRASEEKYRNIVENTADGIGLIDVDDNILFANSALGEIFGVEKATLIGRHLIDFLDRSQYPVHEHESAKQHQGAKSNYEIEITRPDHERRQLRVTTTPLFNSAKQYVGSLGVFRDSTALVNAQMSLIREMAFLSEVELLGQAIIGQTDILRITDDICSAVVRHCEVQFSALVYRSPEDLIRLEAVTTLPESGARDSVISRLRLPKGPTAQILGEGRTLVVQNVEAEKRFADWRVIKTIGAEAFMGVPIRIGGDVSGILFGFARERDSLASENRGRLEHLATLAGGALQNAYLFARLQRSNQDLERMVTQLKDTEQAREAFYRFLVHDLNKPLAAIIGTATRLENHAQLEENLRPRVKRIEAAAARLRDLVAQLLEFERMRQGELEQDFQEFDLWRQVLETARLLAEKHHQMDLLVGGKALDETGWIRPVVAYADPVQITRIVQNLIDNALKYGERRVEVDIVAQEKSVRLSVWNDGPSIPADVREKIFHEFYRRSDATPSGGYGIGLASVRCLVENLRGRIWIEVPDRGGTLFQVELPRRSSHQKPDEEPAETDIDPTSENDAP